MKDEGTAPTKDLMGGARAPLRQAFLHPPGTVVDRYVIVQSLGAGGMGAVYAAYDSELDRRVALKFLLARVTEGADVDECQARLLLEARAMARLSHPNVVTLYQVGPAPGGGIYLAMELVEGGTLQDWLQATRRGWREVLGVLCQAGEGLAAAHRAGMIHRDFKLDNVLVRKDGRPQVTDFGVVRAAAEGARRVEPRPRTLVPGSRAGGALEGTPSACSLSQLTLTGALLGTPGYMAPEQYAPDATLDARADVFAFCATLYRALYRQRPFEGEGLAEVAEATLFGRVREPPAGSEVPKWLGKVVLWGLAPEPDDRPASMDVLLAALRADPARGRRRWIAAGVLMSALCAAALTARAVGERRVRTCRGASDRLGGVWDLERKGEVAHAFRATGRGYAEDTWRRVEQRLDAYATAWTRASYEACAATVVRGEQSKSMMALRADCLDQRLDELSAVSSIFATADGKTVESAVKMVTALSPVDPCSDIDRLSAGDRMPSDPKARAEVRGLQGGVVEAGELHLAGKEVPSWGRLQALESRVNATAYGPLRVAWATTAAAVNEVRDPTLAVEQWKSAISLADGYHLDRERAWSEVGLGRMCDVLGQHAEASVWFAVASGTLTRIGGDPQLELRRETLQGLNRDEQGKYADAARLLEHAIAQADVHHVDDPTYIANAHSLLAFVLSQDDARLPDAVAHARVAVAIDEQAFGRDHPYVDTMLNNLVQVETSGGWYEDALEASSRSVTNLSGAIDRGELPANYTQFSAALSSKASLLSRLGRVEEAAALLERSRAIDLANGTKDWLLNDDYELAEALRRVGRGDEAARIAAEGRSIADQTKEVQPGYLVALGVVEAEIAIDRGRDEDARSGAERALKLAESGAADTYDLARVRLVLARALMKSGRDPSRARELARLSREGFAKLHDARKVEEVDTEVPGLVAASNP